MLQGTGELGSMSPKVMPADILFKCEIHQFAHKTFFECLGEVHSTYKIKIRWYFNPNPICDGWSLINFYSNLDKFSTFQCEFHMCTPNNLLSHMSFSLSHGNPGLIIFTLMIYSIMFLRVKPICESRVGVPSAKD